MDTTGSYQTEWCRIMASPTSPKCPPRKARRQTSIWENVNKRIIPQLLTKGNVFQRESLCKKGMFFITPTPVYRALLSRLGAKLSEFPLSGSALTFHYYSLEPSTGPGAQRHLSFDGEFTTRIENLKDAFNSTLNLPPMEIRSQKNSVPPALRSPKKLRKRPNEEAKVLVEN